MEPPMSRIGQSPGFSVFKIGRVDQAVAACRIGAAVVDYGAVAVEWLRMAHYRMDM
jgi:hypothetical protein